MKTVVFPEIYISLYMVLINKVKVMLIALV